MEGYNNCLLCYGETGSGKSFTMQGNRKDPGLVYLSIDTIFAYMQYAATKEFIIRCSYVEIYNESINDLLNPKALNLQIKEDKKNGVKIANATEEVCHSVAQIHSLLALGEAHKQFSGTKINPNGSSSHCIFSIIIESKLRSSESEIFAISTLNLIDLAGSEGSGMNIQSTLASKNREMKHINKSLITLGTVIMRLSDKANTVHVPFRDSKLTRLLRSSLEGSAKILLICNIAPCSQNYDESLSTLKFAQRAKKINQVLSKNSFAEEDSLILEIYKDIRAITLKLCDIETKISSIPVINDVEEDSPLREHSPVRRQHSGVESIIKEKLQLQSSLERLSSMIINSEKLTASNKDEINDINDYAEISIKNQERRRTRLSIIKDSSPIISEDSKFQEKVARCRHRHENSIVIKSRKNTLEADTKVPDISFEVGRKETYLLDSVDEFLEFQEAQRAIELNNKGQENIEDLNKSSLVLIVDEQDILISDMEEMLKEKDNQISVLKDELELCRSNMARMQRQIKVLKEQKKAI
mmetsp:Transcript_3814/g.3611  ORF Transcript_3814/g.3611 Transcript_3814/m.3611 type:complete len:527 (+) Transcript_3814:230-1810(+)